MNTSRTSPRPNTTTAFIVIAPLLLFTAPPAAAAPNRPDLGDCQNLQVDAGNTASFHVYAVGVQIYRWNGTTWNLVGPDAVLYADAGHNAEVGTHYAGPTWESTSGSKVIGSVLERCTVTAEAVPWLLLEAVSTEGAGVFKNVTYIHRVNTTGGLAPSAPGSFVGEEVRVPYTAEYFFYR